MNKKNTMDFNYIITPPIKKAENIINQALTLPKCNLIYKK